MLFNRIEGGEDFEQFSVGLFISGEQSVGLPRIFFKVHGEDIVSFQVCYNRSCFLSQQSAGGEIPEFCC